MLKKLLNRLAALRRAMEREKLHHERGTLFQWREYGDRRTVTIEKRLAELADLDMAEALGARPVSPGLRMQQFGRPTANFIFAQGGCRDAMPPQHNNRRFWVVEDES